MHRTATARASALQKELIAERRNRFMLGETREDGDLLSRGKAVCVADVTSWGPLRRPAKASLEEMILGLVDTQCLSGKQQHRAIELRFVRLRIRLRTSGCDSATRN